MANPKIPSDFRPLGAAGGLNRYEYAGAVFALLPGGEVPLGFSGRWEPNVDEFKSWKETQEEYGLPGSSPAEFITTVTSPERTIQLPPLLIEVEFRNFQWVPLSRSASVCAS